MSANARATIDAFERALCGNGTLLSVRHKRSGKPYTLEREVFDANKRAARPYVYVWPQTGRRTTNPVWCYLDAMVPTSQWGR